jgi:hypothetical protein
VVVVADGHEVRLAEIGGRPPDLALVDALARLQLAARRRGWEVRLRGDPPSAALRGLLDLVGLAALLGAGDPPAAGATGHPGHGACGPPAP